MFRGAKKRARFGRKEEAQREARRFCCYKKHTRLLGVLKKNLSRASTRARPQTKH